MDTPPGARAAVLSNAAFYGQISVTLPLSIAESGATKAQIALFFAVSAVVAAGLDLVAGPALRRRGSPWWGPSLSGVVAALGTVLVLATAPSAAMYPGGAAMMTMTLVFPHYMSIIAGPGTAGPGRLVGRMRRIFVLGYVAGLALASAGGVVHGVDEGFQPLWIAVALAVANGLIPWFGATAKGMPPHPQPPHPHPHPPQQQQQQPPQPQRPDPQPVPRSVRDGRLRAHSTLLICVLAVLLLRAADSVRLVYLPLFEVNQGRSATFVALLLLTAVIAEVPLLGPITALADRIGSRPAVVLIAGVGLVSFTLVVADAGVGTLIVSQLLYAVFAAGFQSVGMVLLSDVMDGGIGAGADVYTGIVQVGVLCGVVAPLLVPGWSAWIFMVGAAFCLGAMLLLRAIRRRLPPVSARAEEHPLR
jgi:SET family sugar efflux transporter-like MFS transporter